MKTTLLPLALAAALPAFCQAPPGYEIKIFDGMLSDYPDVIQVSAPRLIERKLAEGPTTEPDHHRGGFGFLRQWDGTATLNGRLGQVPASPMTVSIQTLSYPTPGAAGVPSADAVMLGQVYFYEYGLTARNGALAVESGRFRYHGLSVAAAPE